MTRSKLRGLADRALNNAFLLLSLMALFWAGNQVVGRAVAGHIPPIALSFLRWAAATLIILPFAWEHLKRDWPAIRPNWLFVTFLGVLGGGAFNTLQYMALNYTTVLNTLVLTSTGPILIALACVILFRDRLTAIQVVGALISMAGVLTVIARGHLEVLTRLTLNRGDLLILLAMAITGVYTACLRLRPNTHWLSFLFVQFLASAVFNAPLMLSEASVLGTPPQADLTTLLATLYVAIFPSILAYYCFTRGVDLIGGVRAGIFLHLIPVFGALMAIGLLGEPLAVYHVAGFALVLTGVTLTSRRR